MLTLLIAVATAVAIAAAVRSTWSPCGLSMLSSITPISERGRGHRYGATCAWFLTGAIAGGATLGAAVAALAAVVGSVDPSDGVVVVTAAATLVLVATVSLPIHRRQVNEVWLDRYRPWVYGVGFGWQIGVGVATYVKSTGVYALIVLGALTGRPVAALALCTLFGLVRGLAVLLTATVRSPEDLVRFHRRFMASERPVAFTVDVVFLCAAVVVAGAASTAAAAAFALAAVALLAPVRRRALQAA